MEHSTGKNKVHNCEVAFWIQFIYDNMNYLYTAIRF
jgi:hypothetical protein